MTAREYFESVRAQVVAVSRKEADVAAADEAGGIFGAASGTGGVGGGGSGGAGSPLDRAIDAEIELGRMRAELDRELERATSVLYGESGRGGVAAERGAAAADAICGHYLMGMTWQQVADELVRPEGSKDAAHWCRDKASRALSYIDRRGMAALASS